MESEFRALALQLHGLYKADNKVHFKVGRVPAQFWTRPSGIKRRGSMHLHYGWTPRHRMFLRPEGFLDPLAKVLTGLQDLQVGDARFDKAYLIQGSPPMTVLRALTPEVQSLLLRLAKLGRGRGPALQIDGVGTTIQFAVELDCDHWGEVVELGNGILRAFTPKAEDEPCSFCGKRIAGRSRRCRSCKGLSHRKCWEERGGCACS